MHCLVITARPIPFEAGADKATKTLVTDKIAEQLQGDRSFTIKWTDESEADKSLCTYMQAPDFISPTSHLCDAVRTKKR